MRFKDSNVLVAFAWERAKVQKLRGSGYKDVAALRSVLNVNRL